MRVASHPFHPLDTRHETKGEPHWLRLVRAGTVGCAIAVGANLVIHSFARFELTSRYDVAGVPQRLHSADIVVACVVPAVLATVLSVAFERLYSPHAAEAFAVVASVALLVSFGAPLSFAVSSNGTRLGLMAMHVVAALAIGTPLLGELLNEESQYFRAIATTASGARARNPTARSGNRR